MKNDNKCKSCGFWIDVAARLRVTVREHEDRINKMEDEIKLKDAIVNSLYNELEMEGMLEDCTEEYKAKDQEGEEFFNKMGIKWNTEE